MSVAPDLLARFSGPIAPVLTSFDADGELDLGRYASEVDFLLASDVAGISPGGSTGEGAALTDDELGQLVRLIKDRNDPRPIVAGVIRTSTKLAVRTAEVAKEAGADALMVTPTFYNVLVPNDEGNLRFYSALAEVGLPVIIYNVIPQNVVTPGLARRVMEIPNLLGVKQSVGGIQAMVEMRQAIEGRGLTFAATDELLPTCYLLGAEGAISAIVGLFPNVSAKLWRLVRDGGLAEALAIQKAMYPLWEIIRGGQFPARMKVAARVTGRDVGLSRSPLVDGDPVLQQAITGAVTTIESQIGTLS
ncbi:MAG: dihydrodipicolinate synthase family protein [Propionibacteriaceae bacterium]|nr:dihydrodipicolinate synthase family protein [Propionibacteriaceae bacterium]